MWRGSMRGGRFVNRPYESGGLDVPCQKNFSRNLRFPNKCPTISWALREKRAISQDSVEILG